MGKQSVLIICILLICGIFVGCVSNTPAIQNAKKEVPVNDKGTVTQTVSTIKKDITERQNNTTELQSESPSETESLVTYYEYSENINRYINRFNECNPYDQLMAEDVLQYTFPSGRKLDGQAVVYRNGLEITMRQLGEYEVLVYHDSDPNTKSDNDDCKQIFLQFAKPYNPSLSEETLLEYWKQILEGQKHYEVHFSFDGFKCDCHSFIDTDVIDYFTLSGTIH